MSAENAQRKKADSRYGRPRQFHHTPSGTMYLGDSLGLMHHTLAPNSVNLIMTSPPFGLVRKKSYGNEDADAYLQWFRPFAEGFNRVLAPKGSLVIDIGGSWKPGIPARSLYHFELLIMLCREYGFHLCQEHYWWNPAKLPTPAEWVNIRRVRVKDAINTVWWLSKTPWPKASNKRVLAPYSEAMEYLLKNGYKAKLRPSGHDISENFSKRNAGSVPPNLLAVANTESNGRYQAYCKQHGIQPHPARYPAALPEYFIRMLTDPGDTVLDPFAGSCVTGEVAETLKRRWLCCELEQTYLEGARGRFLSDGTPERPTPVKYAIHQPCALPLDSGRDEPLPADGGARRPQRYVAEEHCETQESAGVSRLVRSTPTFA
ncbi:MAG TPA: site-specific DNA-methyltransferase [Candidatus Tumulicola sp.]|jgi:site-specific DNA-methyltransferase (cytosine-N4-specific)